MGMHACTRACACAREWLQLLHQHAITSLHAHTWILYWSALQSLPMHCICGAHCTVNCTLTAHALARLTKRLQAPRERLQAGRPGARGVGGRATWLTTLHTHLPMHSLLQAGRPGARGAGGPASWGPGVPGHAQGEVGHLATHTALLHTALLPPIMLKAQPSVLHPLPEVSTPYTRAVLRRPSHLSPSS